MVDRIGSGGGLAHEAIQAALKSHAEKAAQLRSAADALGASGAAEAQGAPRTDGASGFAEALGDGLREVDDRLKTAERTPEDMLTGKISDFHEVAVQIRQADLSFRFAMEIRNKLVDAYREVMRMNV